MNAQRGTRLYWILFLLVAAGTGAVGWYLRGTSDGAATKSEAAVAAVDPNEAIAAITALGRLEPKDGVMQIAGPSRPTVVISNLLVKEGDTVKQGQVIAALDCFESQEAMVARLKAELENTEAEYRRNEDLYRDKFVSASARDTWKTQVAVARANLKQAEAELGLCVVRSSLDGQVLAVHAYPGERVGPDGILELGRTDQMYAVAEVYETDIAKVRAGQRAVITSPALPGELHGTVERIGMKIAKRDVLDVDPAADTDARVVEVHIRLDDSQSVASLTNLQVEVRIDTRAVRPPLKKHVLSPVEGGD